MDQTTIFIDSDHEKMNRKHNMFFDFLNNKKRTETI